MHRLYIEKYAGEGWARVTEDRYRRIFCECFNIGFVLPKTDTCKTCDAFNISLKSVTEEPEMEDVEQKWKDRKDFA